MGVTAANGRTCIIASSREAKKMGIKTGARTYEALRICPKLSLVSADFVKYLEISKKFLRICQNFSPEVELFSIDEVFVDITLTNHLFGGSYEMIKMIKKEIREKIGEYITVSVGISHNKLLAKLASGINKPDGMFEITKNNLEGVYSKSKLTDVCGIGERIKLRLNKIGIYTLLQLRDASLPLLISEFGSAEAEFLHLVGLGISSDSLNSFTKSPDVKSVGRNYCLPKNEYDKKIVLQNIYELCEEVCIKLRRLNKKARTAGFYFGGNINLHRRKTFDKYFDTGKEMFDLLTNLFDINNFKYVRQIRIVASSLEDVLNTPLSLFDSPRKNKLTLTIDRINEKFGDHTIRNGFLLYSDKLTTVPNGYTARLP
ncbi:MAG: polymerase IV protein [Candidatus Levybacteria bacterium GW2011_GWB1_37_8]|nr:MAG: polymerase IV protein [Candidatus Levybacteria bacterium GW2011_GWB1_37_8]